ncbi:MAG: hypothetical protein C4329_12625, partial [Chitinophagaceae bacterium]
MEEIVVQDTKSELNKLNAKDLFFKYVSFLPLFIISVALALFVAYIYLRYATPVYQSTGALIIEDDSKKPSSGNDKFDQVLTQSGTKNIQNEIEVLKSKPLMQRVVSGLNLNYSYYAKGKIKEMNVYKSAPFTVEAFQLKDSSLPFNLIINFISANTFHVDGGSTPITFGQVFKNAYGVFCLNKQGDASAGAQYRVSYSNTYQVASELVNSIIVAPKTQGTNTILLTLESTNTQLAADVINQLMNEYADYTLEQKNITNKQSKAFIDGRLRVVSHEIDSINTVRLNYMREHNIV